MFSPIRKDSKSGIRSMVKPEAGICRALQRGNPFPQIPGVTETENYSPDVQRSSVMCFICNKINFQMFRASALNVLHFII